METNKEPATQFSAEKTNSGSRSIQIILALIGIALGIYLMSSSGLFTSNDSKAKHDAMTAARNEGYSVYENSVRIVEKDGHGRYFITLSARSFSMDVNLIVFIRLIDSNINFGRIVCPDAFESAAERAEWISGVKAMNNWGISAK